MIRDIDEAPERVTADVCVVGAGAAGLTLARELDGGPLKVVVLESGRMDFDARTQELYRSSVVGLRHGGVHDLRFRVFGGTTTQWAGQALPFVDIDFEQRDWVPGSGWPIDRDDLEPYYRRASDLLQVPRFTRDPAAGWPSALERPPPFDPTLLVPFFSAFSPHPDFGRRFAPLLVASKDVDVILGANVLELVPDSGVSEVALVCARSLEGRAVDVAAQTVVLCCGGIESARLLLVSARRAEGGLGNGRDLVGRYFQDHPGFAVGALSSSDPKRLRRTFEPRKADSVKYVSRFAISEVLQRRERILSGAGGVVFEGSQSPSIEAGKALLLAARNRRPAAGRGALWAMARDPMPLIRAAGRYFVLRQPALDTSGVPVLGIGCEQAPSRDSRVYLSDELDPLGMRRVTLDWRLTEREIIACRRMAAVTATEFERLNLGSVDTTAFHLPDDPDELSGQVIDSGHHMGTTRMANDPSHGVVDPNCRVFGLDNLYVASCSVFPTGGFSNPTFTLIALSLRMADEIRQRLQSQTPVAQRGA